MSGEESNVRSIKTFLERREKEEGKQRLEEIKAMAAWFKVPNAELLYIESDDPEFLEKLQNLPPKLLKNFEYEVDMEYDEEGVWLISSYSYEDDGIKLPIEILYLLRNSIRTVYLSGLVTRPNGVEINMELEINV